MDFSKLVKLDEKKVLVPPNFEDIDRTEMYYFDVDGNACDEANAVRFIAKTFDKNGNVINETRGICVAKEGHEKRL